MTPCEILKAGGIIILPTDTVPGLFALAFNDEAVKRIRTLKGSGGEKPLQVWVSDPKQASELGVSPKDLIILEKFLPGPYTVIVPTEMKAAAFSNGTVGIRCSTVKEINEIIDECGPLAATSLNEGGGEFSLSLLRLPAFADIHVFGEISEKIGIPSTVIRKNGLGYDILRFSAGGLENMAADVIIGSDHAGFEMKEKVKEILQMKKKEFLDMGTFDTNSVDYPDIAQKVAINVLESGSKGILICGTGIGMSIAANRFKRIRAALCHSPEYVELARRHNDANILVVGGRFLDPKELDKMIDNFFNTDFEGGRHGKRVESIEK